MRQAIYAIFLVLFVGTLKAQVNMQTGSAEQSFPLINYVDGKSGLSFGVGLAYSSGNGLQVNDIASDVGTGWSLDASGIIMRIQNGEPDDQPEYNNGSFWAEKNNGTGVSNALKNYPNGYMYNSNVGKGCNVGLNYYPSFKKQSVFKELNVVASDMEQDKFVFRMNGRTGIFVIGRDWKVSTIGDSKIKVSFSTLDMTSQGIRTSINQFVIITEDGIKYTFRDKSLSRLCRYKYSARNQNGVWEPLSGNPNDGGYALNRFWGYEMGMEERPFIVNSWFLSEMENTNTGQKVLFNYQDVVNNIVVAKNINHQRNLNESGPRCCTNNEYKKNGRDWYNYLSNPANAESYSWNTTLLSKLKPGPTSLLYNRSIVQTKRISSISLPNGGIISFGYSNLGRVDLPGEHAIETISYSLNGKAVRSYKLSYGYFFKNSIRPYTTTFTGFESKFARLCLLSVQKIGTGQDNSYEPPYKFSYYIGSTKAVDDIVPARNYLSQDHWGFYNGSNAGLSLSEDHDFLSQAQDGYFKAVLAKYKNPKDGYAKNGLLKSVTYPTGGSIEYYYEQNKPSQNILPAGNTQLAGGVSISKTVVFDGEDHSKDMVKEFFYRSPAGQLSRWGDESPQYHSFSITEFNLKCFNGRSYKYPGLAYAEMATSLDWAKVLGKAFTGALISAGIQWGIAEALSAIGAGAAIPYVNIAIFVASIVKIIIDCTKTYQYHRFMLSNSNNTQQNPLAALYTSVEVRSNSPTGYNGKTFYEFTGKTDYPVLIPKLEWPFSQNQRMISWAYGLPKKVTVYDKDNRLVNESSSIYNFIASKLQNNNNINCNCATINKEAIRSKDWEDYDKTAFTWGNHRWMWPSPYFITTGRTDLASTNEKSYSNGVMYASTSSNIITDPMTLLQKGKIVQKDVNSLVIQLTYYPTDYNIVGSALEKLKQNNAIHAPVATETWLLKINSGQNPQVTMDMLNASVTEYKIYSFGSRQEVKPWKIWQLKSKTPVSSTVIGTHNPSVLLRSPGLFRLQSEMFYDNDGNLVQTNANDNITSIVNDYADRYVVASVANASFSDISYSSFESTGKGNWVFDNQYIQSNSGLTGVRSFLLAAASSISRSGLSNSKSYYVTYWVRNDKTAPVLVNGQQGVLLYETGNWQLYRHELSGITSLSITGAGTIDELRLFPKGSLMSTVTYNEGIGKSSDCDANNRILYYEYDGLGRMRLIRDQNRNVIKTYEYNYKQ